MDNASQAVLALTNRIVDVGQRPLNASEFWSLIGAAEETGSQRDSPVPGHLQSPSYSVDDDYDSPWKCPPGTDNFALDELNFPHCEGVSAGAHTHKTSRLLKGPG